MRVVVSITGEGLAVPGLGADTPIERQYLREAADHLTELAGRHQLVVTHGDRPHLDLLLGYGLMEGTTPYLDVVNAESQGAVGYLLAQELRNTLPRGRRVAALLMQVEVDSNDEAFRHPSAAIGPLFTDDQARDLTAHLRWSFRAEGHSWRRVVPELHPLTVVERDTVGALLAADVVVVCGAMAIPVVADFAGALRGVPGVASPELCTGLLAEELKADRLVFLVDEPNHVDASQVGLRIVTGDKVDDIETQDEHERCRVQAACRFVESTGGQVGIGPLREARAVLDGDLGTVIRPSRTSGMGVRQS